MADDKIGFDNIDRKHRDRILAGASRYVASQTSDPFAGRRIAAHLRIGLGLERKDGKIIHADKNGDTIGYDADKELETRVIIKDDKSREEYKVETYRNLVRI